MIGSNQKGRTAEVARIRRANRAAAVGRLMLGEMSTWNDFLNADMIDLESLPRRMLKSGAKSVRTRVSKEIKRFCDRNFKNMTEAKLDLLYEEVKSLRGAEIPLNEFEHKYSKVHKRVLNGAPRHCTVVISLWGLQYKFPEDYLTKDIIQALALASEANFELDKYKKSSHVTACDKKGSIASFERKRDQAVRSCLLTCFNLLEAYCNGIVWEYAQDEVAFAKLSKNDQKRINGTKGFSVKDKIKKYPKIITGQDLGDESEGIVDDFLDSLKPFRDSLVHPSPFSVPEKLGGYDKLSKFYRIDIGIAIAVCKNTYDIIDRVHKHLNGSNAKSPNWLSDLLSGIDACQLPETE